MFEEAQLYSPVTHQDGEVVVHLADDHPGASDPDYRERRSRIAAQALAWAPGTPAPVVDYTADEHALWELVCAELAPKHERLAIAEFREALAALDLPRDRVPGLDEVSDRLEPLTRFRYLPAAGLVELRQFYGALAARRFYSTQYVRHGAVPLYTPEPDIVHEVIGHGHLLATPTFSELHRLTGEATNRLTDDENLAFLSRVFWFTVEFGVAYEDGELRAYGAGLLSSYGEIDEFRAMEHRPLDIAEMGSVDYDITHYQPVLYCAESIEQVREEVGDFLRECSDESIAQLRAGAAARA